MSLQGGFVNCLGDRRDFYLLLSLLFNIIIVIIIMIIRTNPTAAFLFRFSLEQVLNNLEFKFSEYQVAVVIFVMVAKFFVISAFTSVTVYAAELYPTVIRYGVSQSNKLVPFLMIN